MTTLNKIAKRNLIICPERYILIFNLRGIRIVDYVQFLVKQTVDPNSEFIFNLQMLSVNLDFIEE